MSARVVPFARGAGWLAEGWRLFRVAPPTWLALVFAWWVMMVLVGLVPLIGVAAAFILMPAFMVGFMAASRSCDRRTALDLGVLFEGFRNRLPVQLALGCIYLALVAALVGATTLADDGVLARWLLTGRPPDKEALQSDEFFNARIVAASLCLPIMMLFWFAPVLGAWHRMGAAQALFYSFFACLLNWRAFLVYCSVTALLMLVLSFVALRAMLLASGGNPRLGAMALSFLTVFLLPTLFASFYASYKDVFVSPQAPAAHAG